jgi:hypothetical protein
MYHHRESSSSLSSLVLPIRYLQIDDLLFVVVVAAAVFVADGAAALAPELLLASKDDCDLVESVAKTVIRRRLGKGCDGKDSSAAVSNGVDSFESSFAVARFESVTGCFEGHMA